MPLLEYFNEQSSGQVLLGILAKSRTSDRTAAIASFFLAIVCVFAAGYHVKLLLPLLKQGVRAEAVVTGIKVGARGSKTAIYRFQTPSGKEIKSRDIFQMYLIRFHKGDHLKVIYDPSETSIVTADLGLWIWQGAVIFIFGVALFSILGFLILKYRRAGRSTRRI